MGIPSQDNDALTPRLHQPTMSNPFADQASLQSRDDLDNPFGDNHDKYLEADDDDKTTPMASTATLPYHQHSAGAAGSSAAGSRAFGGGDETAARLEEIRRREQELEQRERTLGQREEHIRLHGRNNWPPKPFWPYPLLYHDIQAEIPSESRSIVLTLYRIWLVLVLTLILNLVACILLLVSGAEDGGKDLGGALVDILVIPLAFMLWYRPAYNGYMKEQAFYYYLYFVFAGFHILFCAYSLIGIPSTGSAGIINTISAFGNGSIVTGVFCTLASAGWGLQTTTSLFMYRFVWKHHNDKGHTFAQAKAEVQMHGIKAYFSRSSNV